MLLRQIFNPESTVIWLGMFMIGFFAALLGSADVLGAEVERPTKMVIVVDAENSFSLFGDGVADDTEPLQQALNACSRLSLSCVLPKDADIRITRPIFLWGKADLIGQEGARILIDIADFDNRYVVNLGLKSKLEPGAVFKGHVANISFLVINGPLDKWDEEKRPIAGRILQLWRVERAVISNNRFEIGPYFYGATAGHINRLWLKGRGVRRNIEFSKNKVFASSIAHGMEGLGIGYAQGVRFTGNYVEGVGDDVIGIHSCTDVEIVDNVTKGVDGRVYISNSESVVVRGNRFSRIASPVDGTFYRGSALLWIGYDRNKRKLAPQPKNILVTENWFYYPDGAIDRGGALSIQGGNDIRILGNIVTNDSAGVRARGVRVSAYFDPKRLSFHELGTVTVDGNLMRGSHPLRAN